MQDSLSSGILPASAPRRLEYHASPANHDVTLPPALSHRMPARSASRFFHAASHPQDRESPKTEGRSQGLAMNAFSALDCLGLDCHSSLSPLASAFTWGCQHYSSSAARSYARRNSAHRICIPSTLEHVIWLAYALQLSGGIALTETRLPSGFHPRLAVPTVSVNSQIWLPRDNRPGGPLRGCISTLTCTPEAAPLHVPLPARC